MKFQSFLKFLIFRLNLIVPYWKRYFIGIKIQKEVYMKCPHCQHDIEGSGYWEFFNCPQCNASLQIEEGKAQLLQAPEAQPPETQSPKTPPPSAEHASQPDPQVESSTQPETAQPTPSAEHTSQSYPQMESVAESEVSEQSNTSSEPPPSPHEENAESANPHDTPNSENNILEFQNSENLPPDSTQDPFQESEQHINDPSESANNAVDNSLESSQESLSEEPEDLSSLNDFGDAPLQENQCVYELKISGIHSAQSLSQVKSILETKILKLDPTHLLSQLKDGHLTIPNLNPIQTIYLVKRLSIFNVQLHWIQKSQLSN